MKPQYVGSDRIVHDIVSSSIAGKKNTRKDAAIDKGAQKYGSAHRNEYPHRNVLEATCFLCIEDLKAGRCPDLKTNAVVSIGHMAVDRLPSNLKTKFQLFKLVAETFKK